MPVKRDVNERFWEKVEKTVDPWECWRWTAQINPKGYGHFHNRPDKQRKAHVWSYRLVIGPVPEGKEIHHLCDNRACVNPVHLEAITPKEHMQIHPRGAYLAKRTHCKNGHPFSLENTRMKSDGRGRVCLTCQRNITISRRRR